jgi:hypothetical protein
MRAIREQVIAVRQGLRLDAPQLLDDHFGTARIDVIEFTFTHVQRSDRGLSWFGSSA